MASTAPNFDHEQGPEKCPDLSVCENRPDQLKLDPEPLFSPPNVPLGESEANYFYDDLSNEVRQEFRRAALSHLSERPSLLEQERPAALHFIFIKLGMSPMSEDDEANKESTAKFMKAYNRANQEAATMDADSIGDLLDTYEDHPIMQVLSRVAERSAALQSTVVHMRKTSLVLLEENSPT